MQMLKVKLLMKPGQPEQTKSKTKQHHQYQQNRKPKGSNLKYCVGPNSFSLSEKIDHHFPRIDLFYSTREGTFTQQIS